MKQHVLNGIDRISETEDQIKRRRIGLMTNQTGIDHSYRRSIDILNGRYDLTALFSVEHGMCGELRSGGEAAESIDPGTGLKIYSLFGRGRGFTEEMLGAFDLLIYDIQDTGARSCSFLYSLADAMSACARAGKQMLVLDRINPLGGVGAAGTIVEPGCSSPVGDYALPTRYALTVGEYAMYVRSYLKLDLQLGVIALSGWSREMYMDDTDLPWVAPSPDCPDLLTAFCRVGTCIFEGSNISEGRGTTRPFRLIGAPFIDETELERRMNALGLPGLHFRRTRFIPAFDKYRGELCRGVEMHVTDREAAEPVSAALLLMDTVRALCGDSFGFIRDGDDASWPIDSLVGTEAYRTGRMDAPALIDYYGGAVRDFVESTRRYRIY